MSHGYGPIGDDLEDMFPDDVTVERFLEDDNEGNTQYDEANPVTVKARVIGRMRSAPGTDGQEHISNVQAMFPREYGFTVRDRYTLPMRFSLNPADANDVAARQPKPLAIDRSTDEDGAHHQVVYFAVLRVRGF